MVPFWLVGPPPILEPILVVGLGCSPNRDFDPQPRVPGGRMSFGGAKGPMRGDSPGWTGEGAAPPQLV